MARAAGVGAINCAPLLQLCIASRAVSVPNRPKCPDRCGHPGSQQPDFAACTQPVAGRNPNSCSKRSLKVAGSCYESLPADKHPSVIRAQHDRGALECLPGLHQDLKVQLRTVVPQYDDLFITELKKVF